jgi:hypothetical protein
MPFGWSSFMLSHARGRQGFFLINRSNMDCRVRYRINQGAAATVDMKACGAELVFPKLPDADEVSVEFTASAPFTYYVATTRPDGTGMCLQHIKEPKGQY